MSYNAKQLRELKEIENTVSLLEAVSLWPESPIIQLCRNDEIGVVIGNPTTESAYPVIWDVSLEQAMSLPLTQWRVLRSYNSIRAIANEGWRVSNQLEPKIDPEHVNPESGEYLCFGCGKYHLRANEYLQQLKRKETNAR